MCTYDPVSFTDASAPLLKRLRLSPPLHAHEQQCNLQTGNRGLLRFPSIYRSLQSHGIN